MTEQQLRLRLETLGAGPATSDWTDVSARAGRLRRRRTMLTVAAAAAALVVAVPTVALATGEIDWWSAEPANPRVELAFELLARHAPAGADRFGIRDSRKILTRTFAQGLLTKGTWTLSIGLRTDGDFCTFIDGPRGGAGGCSGGGRRGVLETSGAGADKLSDGVLAGVVDHPDAGYVEVVYRGGRVQRAELTWVGDPIGTAFFMEQIPVWGDLGTVVVREADGTRIASSQY
jgi:hypothetical protein